MPVTSLVIDLSISFSELDVTNLASYLVAFILPALDALLPIVPSETAIITLGVATAGSTDPRIGVLVALAAFGAWCGDNFNYLLGRWFGPWVVRRFLSGERGTRQRVWAERSLDHYGWRLIIACRFIPGGRTAVTLTCGLIGYNHRAFMSATAVAAAIWSSYAFFIGRLGGKAFEDKPWAGLLLALGVVLAVSGLVEVYRRLRARQKDPSRKG
jgi:membrane protein DedA with SNARE-associated domain